MFFLHFLTEKIVGSNVVISDQENVDIENPMYYRVCHGFKLMKLDDDHFRVTFNYF
jgi:hypothetical protein